MRLLGLKSSHEHDLKLLLILLAFITLNQITYLEKRPLFHEESRRAIIAQEMMISGELVTPTIFGAPYERKPPLHNWLIAAASLPAGHVTRASARAISVLAYLGTVLTVFLIVRRSHPEHALVAALIAATNYLMLCEYGNKAETDILLTFMTVLSWALWLRGPTKSGWIILSGLAAGLGVLAKGTAPLFLYPAMAVEIIMSRSAEERKALTIGLLLHIVAMAALPLLWLLLYAQQLGLENLFATFGREVSYRTEGSFVAFLTHLFAYPIELVLVLMPWPLLWFVGRKYGLHLDRMGRTALTGLLATLVIFTLMPGSRDRYLLPAFPFFAVLMTMTFESHRPAPKWLTRTMLGFVALLSISGAVFLLVNGMRTAAVFLLLISASALVSLRGEFDLAGLGVYSMLLVTLIYFHGVYNFHAETAHDYRPDAETIVKALNPDLPLYVHPGVNYKVMTYVEAGTDRIALEQDSLAIREPGQVIVYAKDADSELETVLRLPLPGRPSEDLLLQLERGLPD